MNRLSSTGMCLHLEMTKRIWLARTGDASGMCWKAGLGHGWMMFTFAVFLSGKTRARSIIRLLLGPSEARKPCSFRGSACFDADHHVSLHDLTIHSFVLQLLNIWTCLLACCGFVFDTQAQFLLSRVLPTLLYMSILLFGKAWHCRSLSWHLGWLFRSIKFNDQYKSHSQFSGLVMRSMCQGALAGPLFAVPH